MKSSFQQFHDVAGLMTTTPDTSTPESGADEYVTVYVSRLTDDMVSNCI
jgi:hypothetical protein